jgi:hypothetical protein
MAQNAAANPEVVAAPPESVKDMSAATRQVLEKLSSMLKDARPVSPSDSRPDRAEAPGAQSPASPKPSLTADANADGTPSGDGPAPAEPQTARRDDGATSPH